MTPEAVHVIDCDYCGQPLDGTACRWRCPRCGFKLNCCEGAPLPVTGVSSGTPSDPSTRGWRCQPITRAAE